MHPGVHNICSTSVCDKVGNTFRAPLRTHAVLMPIHVNVGAVGESKELRPFAKESPVVSANLSGWESVVESNAQ